MSDQPTNYDAIRDIIEPAFRDRRERQRREQFQRVADAVNALPPEEFRALRDRLDTMTEEQRRAWVIEVAN